jgi:hypothetical protein
VQARLFVLTCVESHVAEDDHAVKHQTRVELVAATAGNLIALLRNGFDVVIRRGMQGGTDGKEEMFSPKRRFGNCSPWRVKRRVQDPIVDSWVRMRVCFLTEVSSPSTLVSGQMEKLHLLAAKFVERSAWGLEARTAFSPVNGA